MYLKFILATVVALHLGGTWTAKADTDLSRVQVITSFYAPYSYSEDGNTQGLAVNQVRRLLAELNYFPTIKIYPWARAYTTALNASNTALFSIARTPEREEMFHWIGEIIGFNVLLYRHKNRDDIQVNSLSDLKKYKVGALSKDVKGQYLNTQGIATIDINNEETGIKMLQTNRIDLLPTDRHSMEYRLKQNGIPADSLVPIFPLKDISKPLYIALSKDTDPEIVAAFREAYKRAFP
ncbi:substrate-binding periplasmic protein [Terasakiella pusilla]|uniref:substrate-binding periplasmic protein n=1 Tax=Terasakiella pusilla TaxID=64973 RepID=UPI003AA8D241